jgi:hypothetical protein
VNLHLLAGRDTVSVHVCVGDERRLDETPYFTVQAAQAI